MEIQKFFMKVCSSDRGLSLHIYHNKECFQKLTYMTQQFYKYTFLHSQMHNSSNNDEYVHQVKKVKVNRDSKQNIRNIYFFNTMISMIVILVFKQTINYHQHMNSFFLINSIQQQN